MNTSKTSFIDYNLLSRNSRGLRILIGASSIFSIFLIVDIPFIPLETLALLPLFGAYLVLSGITAIDPIAFLFRSIRIFGAKPKINTMPPLDNIALNTH